MPGLVVVGQVAPRRPGEHHQHAGRGQQVAGQPLVDPGVGGGRHEEGGHGGGRGRAQRGGQHQHVQRPVVDLAEASGGTLGAYSPPGPRPVWRGQHEADQRHHQRDAESPAPSQGEPDGRHGQTGQEHREGDGRGLDAEREPVTVRRHAPGHHRLGARSGDGQSDRPHRQRGQQNPVGAGGRRDAAQRHHAERVGHPQRALRPEPVGEGPGVGRGDCGQQEEERHRGSQAGLPEAEVVAHLQGQGAQPEGGQHGRRLRRHRRDQRDNGPGLLIAGSTAIGGLHCSASRRTSGRWCRSCRAAPSLLRRWH